MLKETKTEVMEELRKEAMEELRKEGFNPQATDIQKNGVTLYGVVLYAHKLVSPCVYINSSEQSVSDIVAYAKEVSLESPIPNAYLELLTNKDWFLKHIRISMQKSSSTDGFVKRPSPFSNIDELLRIFFEVDGSLLFFGVYLPHLDAIGISIDEAWTTAKNNLIGCSTIVPIYEAMNNLVPGSCSEDYIEACNKFPVMYVLTNKNSLYGSGQILDKDYIKNYFKAIDESYSELLLLPSSIHEWIIIPSKGEFDAQDEEFFSELVDLVNLSCVEEHEHIGSCCYRMDI